MTKERFGVISDIHGNVLALEAVLSHAGRRGITLFVNLGDILYGPLWPVETFDLLQSIDVVATVQGNQDRDIHEATPERLVDNRTLSYVVSALGTQRIEWLTSHPKTMTVDGRIFACHGTPDSDLAYLLEDVSTGQAMVKSNERIFSELSGVTSSIILCGHTHLPRIVTLPTGQTVVNPGSVGLPAYSDDSGFPHVIETHSPFASYAIIERFDEDWRFDLVRVPYDHRMAAEQARFNGRSDWAGWLLTGRV